MTTVPSPAQVRAQVESIRRQFPDARAIAIGLPSFGDPTLARPALRVGSEELPVARCESVLALRERLVDLPAAGPPLVVLTDLPPAELGDDLLARFAHRKVFSIEAWQLVKERFQVRHVDPRLSSVIPGWRPPSWMRSPTRDIPRCRAVSWMPRRRGDICSRRSPASRAASGIRRRSWPGTGPRGGVRRPGATGRRGAPAGESGVQRAPCRLAGLRTARPEPAGRRGSARPLDYPPWLGRNRCCSWSSTP